MTHVLLKIRLQSKINEKNNSPKINYTAHIIYQL